MYHCAFITMQGVVYFYKDPSDRAGYKTSVCGLSLTGIVFSNPGRFVSCKCFVLPDRGLCV
jgi:hypothetical protein